MIVIDTVLLVMFFIAWCVLDYLLVTSPEYPDNIHSGDWTFAIVPIGTFACNLRVTRQLSKPRMFLYSILGAVAMCIALALVVMVFGIPFHFQIGGHQ
jgi:multisubunit Na+/H+ antiporter MnhF subunit